MISIISQFFDRYNIRNKNIIIAFSAGPDSCALARLANKLKDEFCLNITLAYYNHMWREEAFLEEEFSKDFAKKFNMNFIFDRAPSNINHSEESARDLRYDFLRKAAKECASNVVLLAHNKDDNIETLIYRVLKGTSPKGLSAIPENRDIFYRPMLKIEKKDILNYLKEINQEYMIDNSNYDTKYKRNFIRSEIIPLFEKVNPNYKNAIDNLITTATYTNRIMDDIINKQTNAIKTDDKIIRSKYLALSLEYRYEILNLYLGDKLKYRDFKTIKKLDNFILENPHSKTSLNKTEFLRTRKDKIFIE